MKKPAAPAKKPSKYAAKERDWVPIEVAYRAGVHSISQLARDFGMSEANLRRKALNEGWKRDLGPDIQRKAHDKLRADALRAGQMPTDSNIVAANADVVADVHKSQRKDIKQTRGIVMSLLDELEAQTGGEAVQLLRELGELMYKPDAKGVDRLNEVYMKVISLPGRSKTMKDLSDSLCKLVALEREAYNIGDGHNIPPPGTRSLDLPSDPAEAARRYQSLMG